MANGSIIVMGSSGFLGSAICVDLSRTWPVIGIDRRPPSRALANAASGAQWHLIDIAERDALEGLFQQLVRQRQRIDFVLHLAAFYHFGRYWTPACERTNVRGLENVLAGAWRAGVGRFIFAGSIASLPPPPPGRRLTERTAPEGVVAYSRAKAIGERMLARYSSRLPTVSLRIGGVFSDWCELPPLYSLMRLWTQPGPVGRFLPGCGDSGFPFIHRRELVSCVRRVLARHQHLERCETLFAAPAGHTSHRELFPVIRQAWRPQAVPRPILIPTPLARWILFIKNSAKLLVRRKRYERRWMMDYVDRPLTVDTAHTARRLGWHPDPGAGILARLPQMVERLKRQRRVWERRNVRRNEGRYAYGEEMD
jgi:nucleoside-diphosphate-sugar epimerase